MTTIGHSENILLNISPDRLKDFLREYTLEGKWENVIKVYYKFPETAHTTIISDSAGTALHVAIDLDQEIVVKELVNAILTHAVEFGHDDEVEALEMKNERGDTPLHFAASRGFARICKCIIGNNNERIYLLSRKNRHGETPLFQAAINWRKQTFAYLAHISKEIVTLQDLVRKDGDSILHTAIRGEYFDLAVIIAHYYEFLCTHLNKEESTPLKVLASRPSAFKSSSNLPWYKRLVYNYIHMEPVDAERTVRSILKMMEEGPADRVYNKFPQNYGTLCDFVSIIPTLFDLKDVKIAKKKHIWSSQLLKELMKIPYAAFTGIRGQPIFYPHFKQGGTNRFDEEQEESELDVIKETRIRSAPYEKKTIYEKEDDEKEVDKKETPFLVAAKNGIVEMVNEILNKIPNAIHDTNSRKENVLLVAVKSRQLLIVETLRMRMIKHSRPELWNSLIHAKDDEQNTILHVAAMAPWQIAGSALEMMWDMKWFQYIESLVPEHFYFISNKYGYGAEEIFKKTHEYLILESNEWLRNTSNSCSVVAVLIAGASFTTSSAVPGGTTEGRPILEDNPAFNVFAFASLSGLCFSVTALIMFLSICTSHKQAKDFRRDLPLKLFTGLSSLFVSLASMFVSFCTGHFFLLSHRFKWILFPIYTAACLPVAYYGVAQFPLYIYLLTTIFAKLPMVIDNGGNFLNIHL